MSKAGKSVLLLLIIITLTVVISVTQRRAGRPAPPPPPAPEQVAGSAVLPGQLVLPRATLGAYGSYGPRQQAAWELSRSPELVAKYGGGGDDLLLLRCDCGKVIRLLGHSVAADGTVSPSVWHDVPDCGWHVHIRLAGWQAGARRQPPSL